MGGLSIHNPNCLEMKKQLYRRIPTNYFYKKNQKLNPPPASPRLFRNSGVFQAIDLLVVSGAYIYAIKSNGEEFDLITYIPFMCLVPM